VRGNDLAAGMSSYLADRILAHAGITVRTATEVTALHGGGHLEAITVHTAAPGDDRSGSNQPCRGLFCFVGATPATGWLEDIAVDDDGFVLTGTHLDGALLGVTWAELGRRPLPFETSQPLVFAVGDVRSGSMKRVAAAVGDGASAIRSVHTALGSAGS
jgi:thioredoxin reductase (NADPH)